MTVFPFDAVVGHDDAKLALRLAAADPRIGGVLLRGEKGSAKTTLARGFAAMLGGAPFVELPLGATEDRVVGTIDVRAALVDGEVRFAPGLLAAAHGGVLYVDEINLLPDHLVDVLLDVAASGENVVERDAVSHRHPARFVLVGSMNPEEGELRPQLLDRFGLCVEVRSSQDLADRVEAVRRRLTFDASASSVPSSSAVPPGPSGTVLGEAVSGLAPAALPDDVLRTASRLALEVGAEGLRADLVLCRAAAALAALDGRGTATTGDLGRVAPLVLAHRSRRGPFDPPVVPPEQLADALQRTFDDPGPPGTDGGRDGPAGDDAGADRNDHGSRGAGGRDRPMAIGSTRRPPLPPPVRSVADRGRAVGDAPLDAGSGPIAVVPTVRAIAARRASEPGAAPGADDLRTAVRSGPAARTIVVAVDLSGSMGAPARAAAATGTVLGLLGQAYERRDRVALVGFAGDGAKVLVAPTTSIEVARNRLDGLATGGETPLAAGINVSLRLADEASRAGGDRLLVLLTDGRATGGPAAVDAALEAATAVRRREVPALVLDCESGPARLHLALSLSEAMGARYVAVSDLAPERMVDAIRSS